MEAGREGFPALGTALETPRLRLRAPTMDDLPHVQRYAVREDFYRYLDMDVPTLGLVARYLAAVISAWEELHGAERVFAIEPKEAGRIAGLIRLAIDGGDNRQGNLGFSLDSDYRGRGYATEALGEVARFQRHQMHRANSP